MRVVGGGFGQQIGRPYELTPELRITPHPYATSNTPHTPHPAPYTLHPTPYTLHPAPYTLHPTPYTLTPEKPLRRQEEKDWEL